MDGNVRSLFKCLGKIIPGHMKILGDAFDLQTAVKIYMYEVDASVNQSAVTCRNRVFLYPRDELKRLFAEINPDEIPVAGTTTAAWVFTPADSVYETAQGTVPITVNRAEPAVAAGDEDDSCCRGKGDTLCQRDSVCGSYCIRRSA